MNLKIAVVIPFFLFACKGEKKKETTDKFSLNDNMLASSEFATVKRQPLKNELKLFGKVTADNNRQAHVFPIVGGNVIKINVELGDYVRQGQVLAVIRSSEVAEFEREKMDAMSDLALAEKNLQVAKDLLAGKLNSEKDVLSAQRELEKSRSELKRINEVFGIYNLSSGAVYNIVAPISGFIIEKDVNQNEQLRNDQGDNIFSIAQIDEVWVVANVNESDIGKIAPGIDADIQTISYPERVFHGKVDRTFNILDPSTRAMKVRIRMPNADNALKPEMSATVILKFEEKNAMLSVPSSAVIFDKSKNWVMVFKDKDHIETRQIEVFRELGGTTYLSGGVEEGERVMTKNQLLIYDALND